MMFRDLPWCNKQCWDKRTSLRLSSHSSSFLCSSRGLVERHTCSGCHEFLFSLSHCDGECISGSLHSSCDTSNHPFPERFCPDVSDRNPLAQHGASGKSKWRCPCRTTLDHSQSVLVSARASSRAFCAGQSCLTRP